MSAAAPPVCADLSLPKVAARLHVSRETVKRWLDCGRLKASDAGTRVRHHWRVSETDLAAFMAARSNGVTSGGSSSPA